MTTPHCLKPDKPLSADAKRAASAYKKAPEKEEGVNWDLVKQYLPLLKSIVSRMRVYFPSQVEFSDLYSLGMAGLVAAAVRFDGTKSTSFGVYAAYRVRGALMDELRRMDYLPRSERLLVRELQSAIKELEQNFGRAPTETEVADFLGISIEAYRARLDSARPLSFVSLDQRFSNDNSEGLFIQDLLPDINESDIRDTCERRETIEILRDRIKSLDATTQKVLLLYYYKGLRLSEIGEVLKLTESRICQIHTQAVLSLKSYFQKLSKENAVPAY